MSICHEAHEIAVLVDASTTEATFDSRGHYDRCCFPGTRKQYISDIMTWAVASDATSSDQQDWGNMLSPKHAQSNSSPMVDSRLSSSSQRTDMATRRVFSPRSVYNDKTLGHKKLSQFQSLIVEPLCELEKQGKELGKRAVFIDGSDKCTGEDVQAEIVEVIANSPSTRAKEVTLPFPELDSLYLLIMKRIPEDILLSTQLFFYRMALGDGYGSGNQDVFRGICHQLHAVVAYQEPNSSDLLHRQLDLTEAFNNQGHWIRSYASFLAKLLSVHGLLSFHHKSFYDFLVDPIRSSSFCVTALPIREKLFQLSIQQHLHHASSFSIQEFKLVLSSDLDYRKHLAAFPTLASVFRSSAVVGIIGHAAAGIVQVHDNLMFSCIQEE
ncbi:hypothetical protein NP233_g3178 [Leucocoprinus birnbaumii]|uniref:Uncharacterized protein n=1 Tax=Leucocoprinus birnbaumii TaxID=56174 RepID=A0AAD5YWN0_9AGAR|nr:hypothetical protein NP233_g3178 [Leucocoprinus birnbaumii]